MALPDKFYLWKNKGLSPDLIEADYEIDSEQFLQAYYPQKDTSKYDISSEGFELIVSVWLRQLLTIPSIDLLPTNMDWLVNSGLFHAIHHGDLKLEALV